MTFVNDDFDLALFLNSRNRIKFNCRDALRSYIYRRRALYASKCYRENLPETATHQRFKHILGLDKSRVWCDALSKPLKLSRDLIKHSSWSLAPNRYDVPIEVYASRKGAGGAHWAKLHTSKSLLPKPMEKRIRYNIGYGRKGARWLFSKNARYRRPTLRIMVASLMGCYKDPKLPGPTNYFPRHHLIEYNISPPIISKPPNPHLFYRGSCVPMKVSSTIRRHISMEPAPGRYETRYPFFCPCNPKPILMPGLRLFIDRQKRNRFRGLPYEHIKSRLYCDPEWRHVQGHGHSYLFKEHTHKPESGSKAPTKPTTIKGSENMRLKMFHDQRYMGIVVSPERSMISWRAGPMPELPPFIKFNSLAKRVIRKQLRSNKKIAFMSGQERWKDGYRLPILTYAQQQAAKETLPFDRRLTDHPVMRVSDSLIQTRLSRVPSYMRPAYMPELRKRLFKFLPLPGAKVLVTEQDTRPEMVDGKYICDNYYGREIIAENFYLDPSQRRQSKDEEQRSYISLHQQTQQTAKSLELTAAPEPVETAEITEKETQQEPKVRLSQGL